MVNPNTRWCSRVLRQPRGQLGGAAEQRGAREGHFLLVYLKKNKNNTTKQLGGKKYKKINI